MMTYEAVIGLEVHVQLKTQTKLFCGCPTRFGDPPNVNTCPVCTAMPGALPVLNATAVEKAILAGLALGCEIHELSIFSRKHYFYLDLPKGYQITQFDHPLCTGGGVPIEVGGQERFIPLTRIHMEEDAGKNLHGGPDGRYPGSLVDLNRAGTPLIEIVSGPDMRSIDEAVAYLKAVHGMVVELGVSEGNMEKGHLRCDANVSVRPLGQKALGTRVEIKNLNSFRFLAKALQYELDRQLDVLDGGGTITQETRGYDAAKGVTVSQRGKEEAHDYRYFPEPDLGPLVLPTGQVQSIRESLGELPWQRRARLAAEYSLSAEEARLFGENAALARYFEATAKASGAPREAANWVQGDLLGRLNRDGLGVEASPVTPQQLGSLIALVDARAVSGRGAKDVLDIMWAEGGQPQAIIDARGLGQMSDTTALEALIDQALADNPHQVEAYRAGKTKLLGFFVGQVMKASKGRADPKAVNTILRSRLG